MLELQYRLDYFSNMKRIKHWLLHVLGQISIFFSQVIHLYGNTNQKRRHHSHDSNVENGGQGKAREHQEMLAIHGYAALGFLDQKAPFEAWISSHLNLSHRRRPPTLLQWIEIFFIEFARSKKGIELCQWKYTLDLCSTHDSEISQQVTRTRDFTFCEQIFDGEGIYWCRLDRFKDW